MCPTPTWNLLKASHILVVQAYGIYERLMPIESILLSFLLDIGIVRGIVQAEERA